MLGDSTITIIDTPLKFNIVPEKLPSQRKVVFQPQFLRGCYTSGVQVKRIILSEIGPQI